MHTADARLSAYKASYLYSVTFAYTSPLSCSVLGTTCASAWTRATLLFQLNTLLHGHSPASPELLRRIGTFLSKSITPIVPVKVLTNTSGDSASLNYVAKSLKGEREAHAWVPAPEDEGIGETRVRQASDALDIFNLPALALHLGEHVAILSGTPFTYGLAALCIVNFEV